MERKIIKIDQEKCNGCGLCAAACHEGAIGMVEGKARLLREDYCDGLGDCLPACPTGAIAFEVREAPAYDAAAVEAAKAAKAAQTGETLPCGCPGSQARSIQRTPCAAPAVPAAGEESQLSQWPVQIKLVPVRAPYFEGARLLVAADCTAYAYAAFHRDFIGGGSPWWAVPSWTRGTMPTSSPRSCGSTTSGASPWCAWRCPAAAAWRTP